MASGLLAYSQKYQNHHRGHMKATIAVLTILAIGYFTMSYTTIIHAELQAANSKITSMEYDLWDASIKNRIQKQKIDKQAELINWNKKHNQKEI